MKEYDLTKLLNNETLVGIKIQEFIMEGILNKQSEDVYEIKGHITKAELFVSKVKSILFS